VKLLLASASPRRRELVGHLGFEVVVAPVDVDESVLPGELPDPYLERVVAAKLQAAHRAEPRHDCVATLVADTSVLLGDRILGKPRDDDDAVAMIAALAGGCHDVATRFALGQHGELQHAETVRTKVWFRSLNASQVARYVKTGEGRDKAGAYAIQGIGSMLVQRIEGSYSNVVGLPLAELAQALAGLGIDV